MNKTIKPQSVKKNLIFQIIYQLVILVIPLLVSPYLTRKLGDTSLGIYSYTFSIAYYFVIFAMLGISKYGQRVIATNKENDIALRKTFWSLYLVHLIFSVLSIIAYVVFVLLWGGTYKTIYFIQIVYVFSALFDITWLFYGLENFKSVVIRNLILKVCECILIFCFVKTSSDLWIYTLIMSCSLFFGQAIMFPQALISVRPIKVNWNDLKRHIKPLFVLFIAVVATTLYTMFDKTLLGLFTTTENVAYYEYANKIITIPKTIISVIGTVLFPRACASIAKGDEANAFRYMNYSLQFTSFIGIGAIFGFLGVSNLLVVLYYGESFAICGDIIICFSPVILIIGLGDIIRTQYMIPKQMDRLYTICLVLNAVLNLVLSAVFIPILGIYGVVIGTLIAEFFGLCFQLIVCRKFLSLKTVLMSIIPYMLSGIIMFGFIYLFRLYYNSSWIHLLLQILIGLIVYCLLSVAYLFTLSPIKHELKEKIQLYFKKFNMKKKGNSQNDHN